MSDSKSSTPPELVAGRDYYLENGFMVFTADFLRRRGYCCESGCRHCPYGFGPEGLRKKLEKEKIEKHAAKNAGRG
jgi:hypothetical protein